MDDLTSCLLDEVKRNVTKRNDSKGCNENYRLGLLKDTKVNKNSKFYRMLS